MIGPSSIAGRTKWTVQPEVGAEGEDPLMDAQAAKRRQQRRVDVDQAVAPSFDEMIRQQPHEAGEADKLNFPRPQRLVQRMLEAAPLGECFVINDEWEFRRLRREPAQSPPGRWR